jgi:hypothetical protein
MFLVENEPEKQEFSLKKKKSKLQQFPGNMFRAEFQSFSVSCDYPPGKKSKN